MLTLPELLAFMAVALPVFVALRFSTTAIDLAYHVRAGQAMIDTGSLLRTDTFTFTAFERPWLDQQWGSQLVFVGLFRLGGWDLLFFSRALLVGLMFFLVYSSARLSGASMRVAGWLTIASGVVILDIPLRPQFFGMVLFALTVWIVAARAQRPWVMWTIPLIVALWANLHGSFFLVAIPLLVSLLEDRRAHVPKADRILLIGLACMLAANLNPFGVRIWSYVVGLSTNPQVVGLVTEWKPTTVKTIEGFLFFASAVALAAVLIFRGRRPSWPPVLGIAVLFVMGLFAVRNTYWWPLAAPVFLAGAITEPAPIGGVQPTAASRAVADEPRRLASTLIAAMLVALAIAYLPWWRPTFTSKATTNFVGDGLLSHAPHRVTDRLDQLLPPAQRAFVPQIWGSWFEFALPQDRVFVDSRIEIFPRYLWDDYILVSDGQVGWEGVLDRWRVSVVVASRVQQPRLIPLIQGDPAWTQIYEDPDAVVFVRASAAPS